MKKILAFLEFWKAVPGPQKIRCSRLDRNSSCSRLNKNCNLISKRKLKRNWFVSKTEMVLKQTLVYVLFTRQQTFCKNFFFQNFICQKKFFLKGSKHKNSKNRYKLIQIYTIFCKIHVSTPPKIFFVEKKIFFNDRVKTKLLRVNTPLNNC